MQDHVKEISEITRDKSIAIEYEVLFQGNKQKLFIET